MAAVAPEVSPRANFPPRYQGFTTDDITNSIVTSAHVPSYGVPKAAWHTLGFEITRGPRNRRRPLPNFDRFIRQVNELWRFQRRDRTMKGRKARAYILDALKTLGWRNAAWNVHFTIAADDESILTRNDWAQVWQDEDMTYDPNWNSESNPRPSDGTLRHHDARYFYMKMSAPAPRRTELPPSTALRDARIWKHYHAFQGFRVAAADRNWYFRAVKVFPGVSSLWASVAYWVQPRGESNTGRNIFDHWLVKARIWTWFMQTLADPTSVRYADYHYLKSQSERYHQNWGQMSLARSLYAGKDQGEAAISPRLVFYVIADYFHTRVVVFHWDEDAEAPNDQDDLRYMDPNTWQSRAKYRATIFGTFDPTRHQILLHTQDWKTFSPVVYDQISYREPGWSDYHSQGYNPEEPYNVPARGWPRPPVPNHQYGFEGGPNSRPDNPVPLEGGCIDAAWWRFPNAPLCAARRHLVDPANKQPIYLQARYNYFTRGEHTDVTDHCPADEPLNGNPEWLQPNEWFNYAERAVVGFFPDPDDNVSWPSDAVRGCLPTPDVRLRFQAGADVPGRMFRIPSRAQIRAWTEAANAQGWIPGTVPSVDDVVNSFNNPGADAGGAGNVEGAQWRFGPDPMFLVPGDEIHAEDHPRHVDPSRDRELEGYMRQHDHWDSEQNNGKLLMEDPWLQYDKDDVAWSTPF